MRVLIIGLFSPEFMIAQANSLAGKCEVTLLVTQQNMDGLFPDDINPLDRLFSNGLLDQRVSLQQMNYPKGNFLYKASFIHQIIKKVRTICPDIVHYHSGGEPWIPLALLFLRRFPLVVSIHDAKHHPGDKPPKLVLTAKNRLLSRLADGIIVHGFQQSEVFSNQHPIHPEKIHVIYLVYPELFRRCSKYQGRMEPQTILFFGRVLAYKGIDTLIKAAPHILTQVPGAKILIAGTGDYSNIFHAESLYPGLFEIHNYFIKADEVANFFGRAALVVLPYTDATQSGIVPIAYMFKKPVVATRVGSIPEVVEDGVTGYLVNPGDDKAMADAVIQLLKNPELCRKMGQAGAQKLDNELSPPLLGEKTMQVYQLAIRVKRWLSSSHQEREGSSFLAK